MNPGTFVMGAGGGGGGKGGRHGGRSGKGAGQGGESQGEGVSGGAKNASACGPGSGGGCPNPSHGNAGGTSAGHPIDPVTGRVYTIAVTDMALPGAFPLIIERAYSSAQRDHDGGLGYGWNHSLGWRVIELRRRRVRVVTESALACEGRLPELGETVELPVGRLTRIRDGYQLQANDGLTRLFENVFAVDNVFRLSALTDRNGNLAQLFYERGTGPLQFVNDSVGRLLRVRRHTDGHIAAFEVKNAAEGGAWTSFRTYDYDERGDLVAARDALGHAITFAYDDEHRLVLERWPTGLEVRYRYDRHGRGVETWCNDPSERTLLLESAAGVLADGSPARGFLHAKVEYGDDESTVVTSRSVRRVRGNALGKADRVIWAGQVHDNEFDDAGELASYHDGLGRAWRMGRADGYYRAFDPLGRVTEYLYDGRSNVIKTRGPDGAETQHGRDAKGNLSDVADEQGLVASFHYDERGCLVYAETADGGKTTMKYDALCNRVEIVEPDGAKRTLRYDFLGRLLAMRDERGGVHQWRYDAMGRAVEYRSPFGACRLSSYDEVGRWSGERDADGRWFRLVYAGLREVVAVERSDGSRVSYAYDRELDLARIVNEEGDEHTIERDFEGRIVAERTFDGRTLRYKNDAAGRLSKVLFDGGESVEFEYDLLDRLTRRAFSDGSHHHLDYDERGRLVRLETDVTRSEYAYDGRGRCTREDTTLAHDPSSPSSVRHRYDDGARRSTTTIAGGWSIASESDAAGRCSALIVSNEGGPELALSAFTYDPSGVERVLFFAGGGLERTKDAHGNVVRTAVFGRNTTESRQIAPPGAGGRDTPETLRIDYQWSPGGDLNALVDRDRGARTYSYDARGRIASSRHDGGQKPEYYALSPRGDVRLINGRLQLHLAGGRLATTNGASLFYDTRGRLIRKVEGEGETTYAWNALGLLTRMTLPDRTRLDFLYDGLARRLEKRVTRRREVVRHRYRWDGDDLLEETVERRATSADTGQPFTRLERRRYAYAPDSPLPIAQAIDTEDAPGAWKYFVYRDGAPLPLALVSADGTIDDVFEAEAYGRTLAGNASATLSRFPGHWYDAETGLHYNRWRYFDPTSATYLSPEPLGLQGGLEAYGYVGGRPLSLVDLDGLMGSKFYTRRLPRSQGGGTREITGDSASQRNPGGRGPLYDLHPAVAAALPQDSGRAHPGRMLAGGINEGRDPSHCSEPHALSNYLYEYQRRNGVSCDPGTPDGQRHLRRALRRMGPIGSTDNNDTACAPCSNCSQTLARLHALAGTGQMPETVPAVPPGGSSPVNFRPAAAKTPLERAKQQATEGNTAALDDARRANATRYRKQLEAERAAGRNNHSDDEIQRRTDRVSGMSPGVFGGTGIDNDWRPM